MSNSRSFRRSIKSHRHTRPSGQMEQSKKQSWNKGLALTSSPSLSTVRRWLKACVDEGLAERKGTERTGKPGRPAVLYGLSEKGLRRAEEEPPVPPEVRKVQWEQVRRRENAWKRRKMVRSAAALKAAEAEIARTGRKMTATASALEQAEARRLAAETALLAVKALSDADGDFSVLLPEEIDTLAEAGILVKKDDRLLLAGNCVEAYDQICDEPSPALR